MTPRGKRPSNPEIDRLELSAADERLIQRLSELYVPELRLAPARRPATAASRLGRLRRGLWPTLVPGAALAAVLVLLVARFSGLPVPPQAAPRQPQARAAVDPRAAADPDWEEHLLFSDVVSQRGGLGSLPPEYRAIESLFFEG